MNKNNQEKEYEISINPRILELLGPNLYTNIYYVLAELIANSYDAGAHNVYIIQKPDAIIVEDDGSGMSYEEGDIKKYLNVAAETRTTSDDDIVEGTTRRRIGRKGVGKLAALSVSKDVFIMTQKNGDKSGFILSRNVGDDNKLKPLPDDEIKFEHITKDGTSIVMPQPQYGLHKTTSTIKKNLLKIFPIVNSDFKIHIITPNEECIIDDFDREIIQELGALIILGEEHINLSEYFDPILENRDTAINDLLIKEPEYTISLNLKTKEEEEKTYNLTIKGWIGAYRSTKGRKADRSDFPDNFISFLSNGKLGEFNILPTVGKNRLSEVFVVGQLHVNLFEETELPDMSLSNRQGYKSDDPRYEVAISYVSDYLLPKIVETRDKWVKYKKEETEKGKLEKQKEEELELRKKLEIYKTTTLKNITSIIGSESNKTAEETEKIIKDELNNASSLIGLKKKVDSQKKRILISQTKKDKPLSDTIYKMLSFNGIPDDDIIYTNSENEGCWIPDGVEVFDYLRDFFVDSVSDQKIFVIYVTSNNMAKSWGAVAEVGAGWITQRDHRVFNIDDHVPQKPLNTDIEWHTSNRNGDNIEMNQVNFNKFVNKILNICNFLGYSCKTDRENKKELSRYVTKK